MKNHVYAGAILLFSLSLALPARATLEGDVINGSASGLTTFNTGLQTIVFDFDPEYTGTLDLNDDGNVVFTTDFLFFGDSLFITMEHGVSGSTQFMSNFTVTFTDLDYIGFPTYVLSDVISVSDTLGSGTGLAVGFTDDSIELSFTNFEVTENREIELGLIFEEDDPVTPIPEPASSVLLTLGLIGMAVRRRIA